MPDCRHVYHVFVIRVNNRDGLMEILDANDIAAGVHYPIPVHLQKVFSKFRFHRGDFPVAKRTASQLLSLPMFPELTSDAVDYVCDHVEAFYA